jgi:hypothetical protein
MSLPNRHVALVAAGLILALAVAGCTQPTAANPPVASPTPTAPSPTPPPVAPIVVDLSPDGAPVMLDNGWTVQHCEGDAPLLCVRDGDGNVLGTVEFNSYPATDDIAAALERDEVIAALERRVADQHTSIAADRAKGCGAEYEYLAEPIGNASVGGRPAVLYGFSGIVDGREIERHRAYYTVHAGQLRVINAAASDPEGCMAGGVGEFAPADLATFEPYLVRIVAGMDLPEAGAALTDGAVVGIDRGLNGGVAYVLWGGGTTDSVGADRPTVRAIGP